MKISKFNTEFELENGLLIYNSITSDVLFLNKDYSRSYFDLKDTGSCDKEDLIKGLTGAKMLVDRDLDETGNIKFSDTQVRCSPDMLGVTIAPTMECNFACPYCFEEGFRMNRMNKETEKSLVEFIKDNLPSDNKLQVCWYGGEPMMNLKSIQRITEMLFKIPEVEENYYADIVTNGYFLNKKNALLLRDMQVKSAQITLDGPPDIHDQRRVPKNGSPTFNTILNNIQECHEIININIRVNVDRTNIDRVPEILDILDGADLKNKVGFYIAAVDDIMDEVKNPVCFSDKEFSIEEIKLYENSLSNGFNLINIPGNMIGICGAVSLKSFVIDPLGDIYKCWDEIGRKEFCVGNVSTGLVFNKVLTRFLNYRPFDEEKCQTCSVLPACMGGCPKVKIATGISRCSAVKHNAKEMIQLMYNYKKLQETKHERDQAKH